ncbi:MAG: alanine--tRNA ligase [Pseudomonadota bacterium]
MNSSELRHHFLTYFEQQGHQRVASSSLIPANDPTLLFTNAGMVPFKDYFLGQETPPSATVTSSQRCVRAGGKHNDLENVGYTARHHTFFEMLGNFSFGDYFKRDAIKLAWNFLTQELKLPEEKLWVTVHIDDQESEDIWLKEMGVSTERFSKLDEDNFWQMGDTGPCGPSSEIFYDHGADIAGDPPGGPNDDGDRYIEIWNLVFMQFERQSNGELRDLPNPSIDTGMGLERIAAVMQGVHNNYDIDLFQGLIKAAATLCGVQDFSNQSLRVIADHIRSCSFLIVDGVVPGNEGRAYVLRRIIRRAIRHGHKLGTEGAFLHALVPALVEHMGDAYPELVAAQETVQKVLLAEEEQFSKTLHQGMNILNSAIDSLQGTELPGDVIFKLYDSHGFPVDLTNDIAREKGLTLDMNGYEVEMQAQRTRSQASGQFSVDYNDSMSLDGDVLFTGYDELNSNATVEQLLQAGETVDGVSVTSSDELSGVVLNSTPFYAESGGQVGDVGRLTFDGGQFEVVNTTKQNKQHIHWGRVTQGMLSHGQSVTAQVDEARRQATALNHTATHLLHAALRTVLGDHVQQKGSLVDSERLRFDFSHFDAVKEDELRTIEQLVNDKIRHNSDVTTTETSMDNAKSMGAMALFGEKYGDDVRVLSMSDGFSIELCGGTHAQRTGDLSLMLIESESGVASGVRRIEAITGQAALTAVNQWRHELNTLADVIKAKRDTLVDKVSALVATNRAHEKAVAALNKQLAASAGADLLSQVKEVAGTQLLVATLEGVDRKALLDTLDGLKSKLESGVIFLASVDGDKVSLVAGVTRSLTSLFKAGDLMKYVCQQVDGKGGGRPDMAQGACSRVADLDAALASIDAWLMANE